MHCVDVQRRTCIYISFTMFHVTCVPWKWERKHRNKERQTLKNLETWNTKIEYRNQLSILINNIITRSLRMSLCFQRNVYFLPEFYYCCLYRRKRRLIWDFECNNENYRRINFSSYDDYSVIYGVYNMLSFSSLLQHFARISRILNFFLSTNNILYRTMRSFMCLPLFYTFTSCASHLSAAILHTTNSRT